MTLFALRRFLTYQINFFIKKLKNGKTLSLTISELTLKEFVSLINLSHQGTKMASTKCYGDLVFSAEFHPTEKNLIVTCGKQHIIFWQLDPNAQHLAKRNGLFESATNEKPKYVLCLAFNFVSHEIVSGDSDGHILFWSSGKENNKITRSIKNAHEGGVFSILCMERDQMITGGKDGSLVEWSSEHQRQRTLNLPEQSGSVRFIAPMSTSGGVFLVGTTRNCVFQVNILSSFLINEK